MNTLLQLIQILLVIGAAAAGMFAGQFSRMRPARFNDAAKFMLGISLVLILISDFINLLPGNNVAMLVGLFYSGGQAGYFITYLLIAALIYTVGTYAFSYYLLTKEHIQQAFAWSEKTLNEWRARQAGVAGQHSLATTDEPADESTKKHEAVEKPKHSDENHKNN